MGKLLREINVVRGAHLLVPVLIRSTGVMCGAVGSWVRCESKTKKAPRKGQKKPEEQTKGKRQTEKGEAGESLGRALAVVFVGYLLVYVSAPRPWTWALWAVAWFVGCCLIAAHRGDFADKPAADTPAGPVRVEEEQETDEQETGEEERAGEETTPEKDHETVGETGEQPPVPVPDADRKAAWLREYVEHSVAAALQAPAGAPVHGKGVRVEDLLNDLQDQGSLPGWEAPQLRALLEGIGIPVRPQMYFKVQGRKANCPGVHVEDLTAALGRAPRLPAHLVPDLTPTGPSLALVQGHQTEGAA